MTGGKDRREVGLKQSDSKGSVISTQRAWPFRIWLFLGASVVISLQLSFRAASAMLVSPSAQFRVWDCVVDAAICGRERKGLGFCSS